ncbi:unnamed protein product [Symbiodinium natans]|uniref:Uncharacterized protein n=1 Tax=Symbiodinium natans TaxID=878477 RepID=A0A812NDZ4_9DINO|nr:unnamed protein product [Symbiodinium natans]
MANLELRMQELENRQILEEAGVRVSDDPERLSELQKSSVSVTRGLKVLGTSAHTLADTVHEAILLVGTGGIGPGSQALIVLGFLVNIVVQTLFCVIIGNSFLDDPYPSVEDSKRWRETIAHDWNFMDQLGATSLASRMCAGDATLSYATAQESIISEIRLYSAGLPIMNVGSMGAILCLLCLTVWWLQILRELWSAVSFGEGCISLPTRSTRLTPTDSGSFRLVSISVTRKVFVVALVVVRFAVAVTLGAVGTLFLLNTGSIQEVVLNAVALGFILETDELFYDTLVPKGVKAVKDVIEPLPLLENTYWGSYTRAGITVGICTALLVLAGTNLNDTLSHMRAIEEEMCGGRKNFVVGLGTATDTSYAVEIRELDEGGEDAGVDFGGAAQARLRSDGVRDLVWFGSLSSLMSPG